MKLVILGATGNLGRRVVAAALAGGHDVTALVRDPARLDATVAETVAMRTADFGSEASIAAGLEGHDAAVNCAGYLFDSEFVPLVHRVIGAAEAGLGAGGRFWMLAGAALLDVPGTGEMTVHYPNVPPMYHGHRINYERLLQTDLDWSVCCPGPMIDAPDGRPTDGLVLSADVWPIDEWRHASSEPREVTSMNFGKIIPRMTIYYEDAAKVIIDNLAPGGRFSGHRVGIALPPGLARHKTAAK